VYNYEDFKNNYMLLNSKIDSSVPVGSDEYKNLVTSVRQGMAYFGLDKRDSPDYNKDSLLKVMNQGNSPLRTEHSEFGHLKNRIDSNIKTNYLDAVNSKLSTTDLMRANPTIAAEKAMISALDQSSTNFKTISSNNSKANFGVDGFTRMNPRTSASDSRKRAINKIKGRDFKSKLASYEAVNGRIPRSTDLFKPYNGPSHLLNHKNTPNTTRITEAINTFNKIQSASVISKRMASEGKGFKPSGARFTNTQGLSLSEINKIRDKEAANSVESNHWNREVKKAQAKAREGKNFNPAPWMEEIDPKSRELHNKVDLRGTGFKGSPHNKDAYAQRSYQKTQKQVEKKIERKIAKQNLVDRFKETAKNSYLNPASKIGSYVRELAENLPNHYADSLTAMGHGVEVRETKSSLIDRYTKKLVDIFNPSESHITESNKKYAEGALKQYEGVNRITGQGMNIDGLSKMSPSQLEYWKQLQRNITQNSLTNRVKGHNIDPFDNVVEDGKGNLRQNLYTTKSVMEANAEQHELNKNKLNEVRDKIKSTSNEYKQFFNNADGTELSNLRQMEQELARRVDLYGKGYNWDHIYGKDYTPDSKFNVHRSTQDSELIQKRQDLHSKIQALSKTDSSQNWKSINYLKQQLNEVDQQIQGNYKNRTNNFKPSITTSAPAYTFDSYRPVFGTGYGLGFKGSMAASGGEHFARAMHFAMPFGTGSLRQAVMESAGIMNKAQKLQAGQARGFAKLGYAAVPGAALGMVLMDMHQGKEASEIAGDIFSMGTALHGWRVGASLGAAGGSMFGQAGKLIGLGLGGAVGLTAGLLAGQAVVGGISDAMSNDSKIRSFAKKAGTKEMYAHTPETNQTLTAKGAALQKLARSGLNDRGLLLGNEASVLRGGM
jgi:hypothetical protein